MATNMTNSSDDDVKSSADSSPVAPSLPNGDAPISRGAAEKDSGQPDVTSTNGKWYLTLFNELGLRDVFASLFVVLGTVVTLLPFLNLEGYGDGIVVAVDVIALLAVSLLLPAKTLRMSAMNGLMILSLIGVAVLAPVAGKIFFTRPAPSAVRVINYDPFNLNDQVLSTLIVKKASGRCWTTSLGDPRMDSWRCMSDDAEGSVYDPCFSSDDFSSAVVCPSAPWDIDVVELTINSLPSVHGKQSIRGPYPWAIELGNSIRCEIQQGAAGTTIAGGVLYFCDDNQTDVFHVDMRAGTAEIGNTDGSAISTARITFAWY